MHPTADAQAWSDAIIHNIETLFSFLFDTPVGLCIAIPAIVLLAGGYKFLISP